MKTNQKLAYAITAVLGSCASSAYAADAPPVSSGLEEIVVTAQRRTESIQNVPITIQALSGDTLGQLGVTTFDDVLKVLPNVTFSSNGPGQGNIYMRGLSVGFAGSQSSASINPFPNVATYLDEQSLTFPGRNLDVYMVDMERIEVLEGPQGTLFGGGAEAGAIRYITNKPKLNVTEGRAEGSYGTTAHGDPNTAITAVLNLPLIKDTLAIRGVFYNDRRGGYIDNVPSTFTRNPNVDKGPSAYSSSYPAHLDTYNNYSLVARDQNPTTYQGFRLSALWQFNDNWNALIQQSYQYLDAEGMPVQLPVSLDFVPLQPLQETSFEPAWNRDKSNSTALTVTGKILDTLNFIYAGAYLTRHVDAQMDYTNYTRTGGGFYYSCTGGGGSNFGGAGPAICYSPVMGWNDYFENTHMSHEVRFSTPSDWRVRGLIGGFWEDFKIKDDMNFNQKTIPSCTTANLAIALAGGPPCLSNVTPINAALDPSTRGDTTNFGEDLERGYKQTAFFGSLDFDLIPKTLTVTAGTRYFRYTENEVGSQYGTSTSCVNIPNGQCLANPIGGGLDPDPVTGARTAEFHKATYTGFKSRANITWQITPDAMVYYTWSQGYRPGAFNRVTGGRTQIWVDAAGNALPNGVVSGPGDSRARQFNKPFAYAPDSLLNNEVGLKSEFLEHRLLVNASLYQMDWKDVQTLIYNPPVYGNTTFGLTGPTYRVKGAELQLAFKATDNLTLMANLSHNDAKQTTSPCIRSSGVTSTTPGNPTPAGACITQVRVGNHNEAIPDPLGSIGDTPAFSPKLQYNLRARYDWTVNDYKAFFQASMSHIDDMSNQPSSFQSGDGVAVPTTTWLRYTMPGYNTYDLSFGVAKDAWDAMVFAQNLTDVQASTYTTSGQDIKAEVPLRPRVVGIKIGLKF